MLSSVEAIAEYEKKDIPKVSKKKSSQKVKTKKADHKHQYTEPVLYRYYYNWSPKTPYYAAGTRCSICGKLTYGFPVDYACKHSQRLDKKLARAENTTGRSIIHNVEQELFKENPDNLPVIEVSDIVTLKLS